MSVGIPPSQLTAIIEGLQQTVEQSAPAKTAPTVEAFKQQAESVGLDPELAEAVYHRLDKQILKNVMRRELSQEKIIEALLYVVISPEEEVKRRRMRQWGELRAALRKLAGRLGITLADVDEVVTDTGFGFKPDLNDIAQKISDWMQRTG